MSELHKLPLNKRPFSKEYIFHASKSGGPGGQHVNKTETKIELRFHVESSALLSVEEKEIIKKKLKNRINNDRYLIIYAQKYRSQLKNKELVERNFLNIISLALKKRKKRIPTKPTKTAREKRIVTKKITSEKKIQRSKIKTGDD